ncbi:glycosyltransferase family 2 protein [Paenibacillus hamazuiensis]|uniref:glycosyltransferase family 2 protein n=1 Tax=Paenibacillus hamazuiensis TaxID=2936508 RepID=UPI00200C7032|nr:glycosyltransferase family 2 protein [Paenibacillus hamazuiensis]
MDNPLVSIITPSFQQASFIQETIQSVLSQDYPALEHIVVDGGSTDGTVAILQKYEFYGNKFRWVSEKDRGQSHALNKGLAMARGEIIGWLNSDDTYEPHAVSRAVQALQSNPNWGVVYGDGNYIDAHSAFLRSYPVRPFGLERLYRACIICQPAAFIRREVFEKVGPFDESLQFCMDYDMWMRICKHYEFGYMDVVLANSRIHAGSKSITKYVDIGLPEVFRASIKNFGSVSNMWLLEWISFHLHLEPALIVQSLKQMNAIDDISESSLYQLLADDPVAIIDWLEEHRKTAPKWT